MRRTLALSLCMTLAACVGTQGGAKPTIAAVPPATAQAAATPAPAAAPEPKVPMTHRQASVDCWMITEGGKITRNLDKRADQVEKCVKAKMKGQPAR